MVNKCPPGAICIGNIYIIIIINNCNNFSIYIL